MNESSYGGSDTASWLLSLGQSLMLSLVLWQPLTLFVITGFRIWLFTWNLEMKFPAKMPALIKRCLCGRAKSQSTENTLGTHMQNVQSISGDNLNVQEGSGDNTSVNGAGMSPISAFSVRTTTAAKIVGNENRPQDLLSFFANELNLIDDTRFATRGIDAQQSDDVDGSFDGTIDSKRTPSFQRNENQDQHQLTVDQLGEMDMAYHTDTLCRDLDVVLKSETLQIDDDDHKRTNTNSAIVQMISLYEDVDAVLRDESLQDSVVETEYECDEEKE